MKTNKSDLLLIGYISTDGIESGFVIPLFELEGDLVIQNGTDFSIPKEDVKSKDGSFYYPLPESKKYIYQYAIKGILFVYDVGKKHQFFPIDEYGILKNISSELLSKYEISEIKTFRNLRIVEKIEKSFRKIHHLNINIDDDDSLLEILVNECRDIGVFVGNSLEVEKYSSVSNEFILRKRKHIVENRLIQKWVIIFLFILRFKFLSRNQEDGLWMTFSIIKEPFCNDQLKQLLLLGLKNKNYEFVRLVLLQDYNQLFEISLWYLREVVENESYLYTRLRIFFKLLNNWVEEQLDFDSKINRNLVMSFLDETRSIIPTENSDKMISPIVELIKNSLPSKSYLAEESRDIYEKGMQIFIQNEPKWARLQQKT